MSWAGLLTENFMDAVLRESLSQMAPLPPPCEIMLRTRTTRRMLLSLELKNCAYNALPSSSYGSQASDDARRNKSRRNELRPTLHRTGSWP